MKVNLLQTSKNDFMVLLDKLGMTLKVNNENVKAVVTNTSINVNALIDDRYISTDKQLRRGDHVQFNNKDWYVINQINNRRYESYKGQIRCAEHYIRFNLSMSDGTKYISYVIKEVPCIIQTTNEFGVNTGRQIIMPEGEVAIFIQDNSTTRAIYNSQNNTTQKHDIVIEGVQYTITGFSFIDKGLVRINAKITSTGNISDGIVWKYSRSDWDGIIDKSFYDSGNANDPRTDTKVGVITTTITKASTDSSGDGAIHVSFEKDSVAIRYRVTLKDESNSLVEVKESTTISVFFTGLAQGVYSITVESFNGTNFLTPQGLNNIKIEFETPNSGWGDW